MSKKLGGIVPRCLRKIMKRTIPILRSRFGEKPTTISQVGKMAWDWNSELLDVPTRWALVVAPSTGPRRG